jgi:hypothetical protein
MARKRKRTKMQKQAKKSAVNSMMRDDEELIVAPNTNYSKFWHMNPSMDVTNMPKTRANTKQY